MVTVNTSLRRKHRAHGGPLPVSFDVYDLNSFHPLGDNAAMLSSLMGETVRPLPLACEWEEIPLHLKTHIFPTLEVLIVCVTSSLINCFG